MSVINLSLQCVGVMRREVGENEEAAISSCNNMSQIRQVSDKKPELVLAVCDSIAPVKTLLSSIRTRLDLHDEKFQMFLVASEQSMKGL